MEEEELLRQRIVQPNPLIQPNQTTPDRTCSQVTTTDVRNPERELTTQLSPQKRPSPTQPTEPDDNKRVYTPPTPNPPPVQPMNKLTPQRITKPPITAGRRLQWDDQVPKESDQHGSRVRNVEIANPEPDWKIVEVPERKRKSPVKPKIAEEPKVETEHSRNRPKRESKKTVVFLLFFCAKKYIQKLFCFPKKCFIA